MSKYTAEQVIHAADLVAAAWCKGDPLVRAPRCHKAAEMLRDYAALLREREAAKAGMTEDLAIEAGKAIAARFSEGFFDQRMVTECGRAALEAVAPMLASTRVPDGLLDLIVRYGNAREGVYRAALEDQRIAQRDEAAAIYADIAAELAAAPKRGEG